MKRVTIANLHRHYRINEKLAERIIRKILRRLKKSSPAAIEVVFLDDRAMRRMNRIYKKSDRFTDVLSFRLDGRQFGIKKLLGSILISIDRAKANSVLFGRPFTEELVRYMAHGVLHLFGYDDGKSSDKARMAGAENRLLEYLCRKEDLSKVLTPR